MWFFLGLVMFEWPIGKHRRWLREIDSSASELLSALERFRGPTRAAQASRRRDLSNCFVYVTNKRNARETMAMS
jgi:hypothetical protein